MRRSLALVAAVALLVSGIVLVVHEHGPSNTDCRLCHAAGAPQLTRAPQLPEPPAPVTTPAVEIGAGHPGGIAIAPIVGRAPPPRFVTV